LTEKNVSAETLFDDDSADLEKLSEKTFPQKRADVLLIMAEQVLAGMDQGLRALAPADKYQVVINLEADALTRPETVLSAITRDSDFSDLADLSDGHDCNHRHSSNDALAAGHACADAHKAEHVCHADFHLHGSLDVDDIHLPLPASVLKRLCCDASLITVVNDGDGNVLNVGRKTRAIPPAIRRALKRRDHGCRFPGCCETKFVDAHHIVHWSDGGETRLDNLILLCRHHHRLLHQEAYEIVRTDPAQLAVQPHPHDVDLGQVTNAGLSVGTGVGAGVGTGLRQAKQKPSVAAAQFVFVSPSGQTLPHSLTPQFVSAADAAATETLTIEREHDALGLQITAVTAVTHWQGERLDFDFAVDVMLSSARQAPLQGPYQAL
jgi:hypothetical protein